MAAAWFIGGMDKSENNQTKNALFIFQDYTDADNFISVVDLLKRVDGEDVFLFLIGRRADFSVPFIPMAPFVPQRLSEQFDESEYIGGDNEGIPLDSYQSYMDGARRMYTMVKNAGLWDRVTKFVVDDAFIPTQISPLSPSLTVLDFLFDRADLVDGGEIGQIITRRR